MNALLPIARAIDAINERIGRLAMWLVLVSVVISTGNALVRYAINYSSNALLEIQWYLFSAVFLLCAAYTFKRNEHVRIDLIIGRLSEKGQCWIDVFGIIFFLFPLCAMVLYYGVPQFVNSYVTHEISSDAGGLVRWPARILIPLGFGLLALQGVAELIKRLAFIQGLIPHAFEKKIGGH